MNFPPERTAIVHVGCDASLPVPNREESRESIASLGISSADTVLCFIGTIYQSDLNFLFRSLDIVRSKTQRSFKVLWIGSHRLEPLLLSAYNIVHVGHLPTMKDVYRHLAASDIALLPFVVNTANKARWHSKITDYFNMALPVVATPVSDFPAIFAQSDCGWMAASGTPEDFAQCLITALENPSTWRTKGETAKQYAIHHLDTGLLALQLTRLYGHIIHSTSIRYK